MGNVYNSSVRMSAQQNPPTKSKQGGIRHPGSGSTRYHLSTVRKQATPKKKG